MGDVRADIASLFKRNMADLRRYLSSHLNNQSDVDDCLQEAFLRLWRQELKGALREDARGYLFATALNVVRDQWRRRTVRLQNYHVSLSDDAHSVRNMTAEDDTTWKDGLKLVEAELNKLRPSTAKAFLLYHVDQMTMPEIAAQMGVTTRTVEREIARALHHLHKALGSTLGDLLKR